MVEKMEELIFNAAIDNIKFIKTQEWVLTTSALTLFGAVIAGSKYLVTGPLASEVRYVLSAGVVLIAIFSWRLFHAMSVSLESSRNDVDKIIRQKSHRTCFDRCGIFYCLMVIVTGGAITCVYSIFCVSACH